MNAQSLKQRLIGAWRITAYKAQREDGDILYPMGADAVGYILYTHDGYMTATLMQPKRAHFAIADLNLASAAERAAAAASYFSYAGTYEVDEANAVVTHRVELSLLPNWVGIEQRRKIILEGDQLELRALAPTMIAGEMRTVRVFWERAK